MANNIVLRNPYAWQTETKQLVVVFHRAGNQGYPVYDAARDKGRLVCPHCLEAQLHYCAGSQTKEGDNRRGASPHFRNNDLSRHSSDCLSSLIIRDSDADQREFDLSKGFKIHLNLGTHKETFNQASAGRKKDLENREVVSAKKVEHFLRLMRSGQIERVQDSVIIHHDLFIPWSDFFVCREARNNGEMRWPKIAANMRAQGSEIPALFHVKIEKPPLLQKLSGDRWCQRYTLPRFTTVFAGEEKSHLVVPLLKVTGKALADPLEVGKEYFVLATNRLYQGSGENSEVWFMDVPVSLPERICRVDLLEIARESRVRARSFASSTGEELSPT